MKKKRRLSKIAIGICVLAVVFAFFNVRWMHRMKTTAQDIYEHPYIVSNTARGMRSRLLDMKRFVGIFLTIGYDGEAYSRALLDEGYAVQNEAFDIIREQYLGPAEDVRTLRNAMDNLILIQEEAVDYVGAGHTNTEIIHHIDQTVYPCYDEMEEALDEVIRFADSKILELTESAANTATFSIVVTVILTIAMIVLTVHSNRVEQKSIQALTEREQELEDALSRAEKASNAKREFLSRMSHEMRTPLNSVLGGVHLARTKKEKGQDNEEELKLVEHSGQYLLNLINDILDVNRIDAGKIELYKEWCGPMETIQTAVKMVLPMMEQKKIHFVHPSLDPKQEIFQLHIDPQRVKQVLINLLNNAAKFTPEGGTVTLSVKNICHDDKTATDCIIISDTGCGMSEEFVAHIGEAFSQERNDLSRQTTGSGLGLYIVKRIVDLMGGTLSVESVVGKGTTFCLTIAYEYRLTSAFPQKEETAEERTDLSGLRVLCAEDNTINQVIARELLEHEGIQVTMVSDGAQALETFRQSAPNTFQVILMDLMMPVMNGLEATKAIRQLERPDAGSVPIVAASADAIQDNIEQALAFGITEYLTKPIDPHKLYQTLAKYAGGAERNRCETPVRHG